MVQLSRLQFLLLLLLLPKISASRPLNSNTLQETVETFFNSPPWRRETQRRGSRPAPLCEAQRRELLGKVRLVVGISIKAACSP